MPHLSEDRPIYLQIKEYLENEILEGRLTDDEQIPSTNELASFFGINPITVIKGVTLLTDKGIIYKKRGIGMFVKPGAHKLLQKRRLESFEAESLSPLIKDALLLQLSREELHKMLDVLWDKEEKEH